MDESKEQVEDTIQSDLCCICGKTMSVWNIAPTLEFPDGTLRNCCEECADREFPGWENEVI